VVAGLRPGPDDRENYCLASTGNALQCSRFESWLAGWGKEAGDALGGGDASREDVDARCVEQPDLMMWPGPERDGWESGTSAHSMTR
jgi:hypothetical protein